MWAQRMTFLKKGFEKMITKTKFRAMAVLPCLLIALIGLSCFGGFAAFAQDDDVVTGMPEDACIEHVFDNESDPECNVCGLVRPVFPGASGGSDDEGFNTDEDLLCDSHVYDNACDIDCNVCRERRSDIKHTYDNGCDLTCNVCYESRSDVDHTYDNECDSFCNVCDWYRKTEHAYEYKCSVLCSICGNERITAHYYDNECDADCNECGDVRIISGHLYSDESDTDCDVCGEVRTLDTDKGGCGGGAGMYVSVLFSVIVPALGIAFTKKFI